MSRRFASALTIVVALASPPLMSACHDGNPREEPSEGRHRGGGNVSGSKVFFSAQKGDPEVFHLLDSRAVQREIGLRDEQAEKIDTIIFKEGEQSRRVLMQFRNTHDPEKRAEVWTRLTAMCTDIDEHIKDVLDRPQVQRVCELTIQNMGLRALLMPEVVKALHLMPEQQKTLHQILPPLMPMDTRYEVANAATERARPEVERVLTKEQKERLSILGGAPFDPEKHRRPRDRPAGPSLP